MKLRKNLILLLVVGFVVFVTGFVVGSEKISELEEPALLSSIGQSPDVQMMEVILNRVEVEHTLIEMAYEEDILEGDYKTLILVIGGSSKGLGEAGIDQDEELERAEKLIELAKKEGIKVVSAHVGGIDRRGSLTDPFLEVILPGSDMVLYLEESNEDGFFDEILEGKEEIKRVESERTLGFVDLLGELFGK